MTTTADRKVQLRTRLDDLHARLGRIETELDAPHTKDWDDLAIEREQDEVLEGMGVAGQQEIRQIEAALQRIDSGDYGFCAKCGTTISDERLDVLPQTPFCRTCAT